MAESEDPRGALVSLMLELEPDPAAERGGGLELAGLPMKELRDRAKAAGATAAQLEEVAESEDPRGALVSLLALIGR